MLANKLIFKFGRSTGSAPLEVALTPVTVFVGPNNSGKSRLLREMHTFANIGGGSTTDFLLESIVFNPFPTEKVQEVMASVEAKTIGGEHLGPDQMIVEGPNHRFTISRSHFQGALAAANQDSNTLS